MTCGTDFINGWKYEVGCKMSVVFLNFFTMANFMWLLVEALYLNYLLLSSFPQGRKYYCWLVLFGWGLPTFFTTLWIFLKVYFEDVLCWDANEDSPYWWVIQGPIMLSVAVNFILFINTIQILLKKLNPRNITLNNSFQYRRLSKSTLLLIPLFGTHYIIFNFLPEYSHVGARLYLELCVGSFQGFIVAVLYCFLNQEVQTELCRKWRGKNYECMMPSRRKKTKWTMPTNSGIKVTNLVFGQNIIALTYYLGNRRCVENCFCVVVSSTVKACVTFCMAQCYKTHKTGGIKNNPSVPA
ncbi:growth hormone-releasing hormone receptor-like [Thamnophis elegans]|uniref:growth hormone-releasing hormone receptor-like n=1 Tax=Thamnophis elegans TaxID=35005 RepID=UPI0013783DD7|nr:growth hormone-releasing hormone receptor-like [Thamnophis elegans]